MTAPEQLCPRCKKTLLTSGEGICQACQTELLAGGGRDAVRIEIGPVLRDALATAAAGEDFEEALLRALKRSHPSRSAALFPAFSRLLETEAERTGEDRRRVAQRMADSEDVPGLTFISNLDQPTTVTETRITTSEGKTYHSLDELPPHLRRSLESQLSRRERPQVKMGCSSVLLGGCLALLLRALWR